MPNLVSKATQPIVNRVRQARQQELERSMAGGEALVGRALPNIDELKPHGPVVSLPASVQVKNALLKAFEMLPTAKQTAGGAITAGKFAGYGVVSGLAGIAVGTANYYALFMTPGAFLEKGFGDPHTAAAVGLVVGLGEAALLATNRYELAGAVAAGIGTASFTNGFLGVPPGFALSGAASALITEPYNLWRWFVRAPVSHSNFITVWSVVAPTLQAVVGTVAGISCGIDVYKQITRKDETQTSAV